MKLTCNRRLLSNAVAGVSKAATQRSSIPVLEGILLKAEGFELTLTGYNLEMGITTTIEANVLAPGEIVFPAKLLGDITRGFTGDNEVEIEVDETGSATIHYDSSICKITGMNPGDFPPLPKPGAEQTLDIDFAMLREMVETTLYAVSHDDKKPAHTGELFVIEPEQLTVVALDGFRLAITQRPVKAAKEISIIIPEKTLSEASKLFTNEDEIIHIAANRNYVVFSSQSFVLISRLIEGDFLDYKRVLPDVCRTRVTVDVQNFISTIDRAKVFITERLKSPLRITFDSKITVRSNGPSGNFNGQLAAEDAKIEGDPVEIGFNHSYLLDALRNSRASRVVLEMNGPLSPVKILPETGDEFLFLVLPVRFKND